MPVGRVSLVGAGPGDPELLTLRAYKTLQSADVIFFDSLLSDQFKDLFPKGVPHFHVGKRCDNHTVPQRQIEQQLVKWAQSGHHVVRLKGGDPFIFGRGGEEIQALIDAQIPVDFVPGLSSLNGIASTLGLPLTHRELVRKLLVVEGHTLGSKAGDYEELAKFTGTVAIFMASRKVSEISKQMIAAGANPQKKLILVESDQSMCQHWQIFDLQTAAEHCQKQTSGPGIIYISATIDLFTSWEAQRAIAAERIQHEHVTSTFL